MELTHAGTLMSPPNVSVVHTSSAPAARLFSSLETIGASRVSSAETSALALVLADELAPSAERVAHSVCYGDTEERLMNETCPLVVS